VDLSGQEVVRRASALWNSSVRGDSHRSRNDGNTDPSAVHRLENREIHTGHVVRRHYECEIMDVEVLDLIDDPGGLQRGVGRRLGLDPHAVEVAKTETVQVIHVMSR